MKKKLNNKLQLNKTNVASISNDNLGNVKGGAGSDGCNPTVSLVVICPTIGCPVSLLSDCRICLPTGSKFC